MTADGSHVAAHQSSVSVDPTELLLIVVATLGALLYVSGLVWAVVSTLGKTNVPMPSPVGHALTSVGAVLATNFGAVLGLPTTRLAVFSWSRAIAVAGESQTKFLQIVAAWVYFVCLVAAAVVWAVAMLKSVPVMEPIQQMSLTLIGVAAAALAVLLSRK